MRRDEMLLALARRIAAVRLTHPTRVAIDGPSVAGKSWLADELAQTVSALGRPVLRISLDAFFRPRAERYRLGRESPVGYYEDSLNYDVIWRDVLGPLGPGGSLAYRRAAFDFRTDSWLDEPLRTAPPDAVALVDGIFLMRPELRDGWDYRVFVHADFEVTVGRALTRDVELHGSVETVRARYAQRYVPGETMYFESVRPRELADAVVLNNDPLDPDLIFRRP